MLVRGRGGGCKRPGISTGFNVIGGTPGVSGGKSRRLRSLDCLVSLVGKKNWVPKQADSGKIDPAKKVSGWQSLSIFWPGVRLT